MYRLIRTLIMLLLTLLLRSSTPEQSTIVIGVGCDADMVELAHAEGGI